MTTSVDARHAAARAFVRSLNILLKFARMYDFGHPRTVKQYDTAWSELRAALGSDNEAGLLLAVSGDQLLLDGTPLESAAAEKSFARMLSAAGIASIHFSPNVNTASLGRLVKGFPTSTSSKSAQLAEQLKTALRGDPNIHVNEICFVPADSAVAKSTIAAQLAARTLTMNSEESDKLFNDPERLLQLMVAAEGNKGGNGEGTSTGTVGNGASGSGPGAAVSDASSPDAQVPPVAGPAGGATISESVLPGRWSAASRGIRGSRSARGGPGSMAVETGLMTLHEDELQGILQVLAQIARTDDGPKEKLDPASFQTRLSTLPRRARFTVSQALSALAAQAPSESSDKPALLKLAEHIAVRFAMESYERGDVKVNAVRQMLEEMGQELAGLRKILGVYEEKMTLAGIEIPSHVDSLSREFWSQVPEEKKREVIESAEVWCVPAAKVREYIEGVQSTGETENAENILRNYATCITNESAEIRRQTAIGIAELAPLYAASDERLLMEAIRQVGVQLAEERDSQLQSFVSAAFVRLSQEATTKSAYRAIQRSVELIEYVETERPGVGKNLRPRIAVENRLPEFIEESLRTGDVPSGLRDLLRRIPEPAAQAVAARFGRAGFREDCETLVSIMQGLGPAAIEHLRNQLQQGSPTEATDAIGILARIDLEALEQALPARMKEWKRTAHDRVVRQIAASGARDGGRILLALFDHLDPLIRPLAIDEIGMAGEQSADMRLLRIAEGDLAKEESEYLRLKAIEALGRLRTPGAEGVLRKIAEARKTWRWVNPPELRLVAIQTMRKFDPEWVRSFVPRSGLNPAELALEALDIDPDSSAIRQRRYPRLRLERPLAATTTNLRENCRVEIAELTLGGGVAICEQSLHPGSLVELRFNPSQKSVKAQTIVRDANTQARAFEVVNMDLEERSKLRKLLVQLGNSLKQSTPQDRSRRGTRTIFTAGS
jgi:hypothetical protein